MPSDADLSKFLVPKGPAKTFKQHLAKTQVSDEVLEILDAMPDPGPIPLLNFVRFRPDRDPTYYMAYGKISGAQQNVEGPGSSMSARSCAIWIRYTDSTIPGMKSPFLSTGGGLAMASLRKARRIRRPFRIASPAPFNGTCTC